MSRGKAITLAAFTVWPLLYVVLFFCAVVGLVIFHAGLRGHASEPPMLMMVIFPLHFLTMLEIFVLLAIYIVHLFRTDRV
ncbi:MAG TPA: hypothetical protein PKM88_14460, partial [bacterium]|nr:hypothetical protein [bacterium]